MSDPQPPDPGAGDAGPTLEAAAGQLYALSPEEFVPTRTALSRRARAHGDRAIADRIAALRRPSLAAWAVNRLVRDRPESAHRLLELGDRLRSAQARLDAASLRRLRAERDLAVEEFTTAAADAAAGSGRALSAGVLDAIRGTAVAALADLQAAEAVASGTLTRALSYSGFGEVDLADAVAHTSTGVALVAIPGGGAGPGADPGHRVRGDRSRRERERRERERRERELRRAEIALAGAERQVAEAREAVAAAERALAEAISARERSAGAVERARGRLGEPSG